MINIIIFSLLMCILHTDAAEGPGDDAEGAAWFTGKAAAINCGIVQSKLANYIAFKESMMLQVCCSLFQSDYHWFEGTSAHAANHKQAQTWQRAESLVKIDIDVILHILRKKSESNAEELAATFSESDDKVYNGEMIYHAFVRCVPDFEYSDVEKMLTSVPQLIDRPETLKRLKRRYSRKMEEKFSSALRHLLWRKDYSLKVPSDLKPHKDICSIALADCPFVQQFVYYYQQLSPHPMHCDFVYSDPYMQNMQSYVMDPACAHQYLQQYQQPMHGAFVPQWGQPMRSGVMMPPGCVYQDPPQYQQPMHGAFVPQWGQPMQSGVMMPPGYVYQYPPQHQYPPQFQHPNPMHGALMPECFSPMQNAVMDPRCAPQIQTADSERYLEHLRVYVWRGTSPNLDLGEPDYVAYAYAEKKVNIADELPKMLDRIGLRMKKVFPDVCAKYDKQFACEHNVRVRLDQIKDHIPRMTCVDTAIIFAWAFAMERQGDRAWHSLGFLKGWKDRDYLWLSCRKQIPDYLYALTECTDIEEYGGCMRNTQTSLQHKEAKGARSTEIAYQDCDNYSPKWRKRVDLRFVKSRNNIAFLFGLIFPEGDAPGAIDIHSVLQQ